MSGLCGGSWYAGLGTVSLSNEMQMTACLQKSRQELLGRNSRGS